MVSKAAREREAKALAEQRRDNAVAALAEFGFRLDDTIRVDGEGTRTFVIKDFRQEDGSLTCIATVNGYFRSFRPEWCYLARRTNRRGRLVANSMPKEVRGQREAWQMKHFGMTITTTSTDNSNMAASA